MVLRKKKPNPAAVTADVVAIAHFAVANIVMLIGELTDLFDNLLKVKHPGIQFVLKYLDAPVHAFLSNWFSFVSERRDLVYNLLATELVIVAASIFYGFIVFLVVKLICMAFGLEDNRPIDSR